MKMKKIYAVLLSIAVLFCTTAIPVLAEEPTVFDLAMQTNGSISVNTVIVNSQNDSAVMTVSLANVSNLGAIQFDVKYGGNLLTNVKATNKLNGHAAVNVKADGISYAFATANAVTNPNTVIEFTCNAGAGNTVVSFQNVKAWDFEGKSISLTAKNGNVQVIDDITEVEIEPKTTVAALKTKLGVSCEVKKNGAVLPDSAYIGTGCTVTISSGSTLQVVISGDVDGNGMADVQDIIAIQGHILRILAEPLAGDYLKAADLNKDGKINVTDILALQNKILGIKTS